MLIYIFDTKLAPSHNYDFWLVFNEEVATLLPSTITEIVIVSLDQLNTVWNFLFLVAPLYKFDETGKHVDKGIPLNWSLFKDLMEHSIRQTRSQQELQLLLYRFLELCRIFEWRIDLLKETHEVVVQLWDKCYEQSKPSQYPTFIRNSLNINFFLFDDTSWNSGNIKDPLELFLQLLHAYPK